MHTKFHKNLFRNSKLIRTDSQTPRQHGDHIILPLFFQNRETRLKFEEFSRMNHDDETHQEFFTYFLQKKKVKLSL
jgi:NhaP-type Na+/H+ and K+/H+ antiporter